MRDLKNPTKLHRSLVPSTCKPSVRNPDDFCSSFERGTPFRLEKPRRIGPVADKVLAGSTAKMAALPASEPYARSDPGRDLIAQKNRAGFTLPGGFDF